MQSTVNSLRRPPELYRILVEMCDRAAGFALATVLQTDGSTPCSAGAKGIIDERGAIQGTVGGGLAEATAQARAVEAIKTGLPEIIGFSCEGSAISDKSPVCGGNLRILIDPTVRHHRAAYALADNACARRERGVLLTEIRGLEHSEVAVEVVPEVEIARRIGFPEAEAVQSVLMREQPRLFVSEHSAKNQRLEVFVEPLAPAPSLVIVGAGHIGQAVAVQASLVGFDVTVIDDRPELLSARRFPEAVTTRCAPIETELSQMAVEDRSYVVIVTRGHQQDAAALAACLPKRPAYLGMIGSRRKVALMREEFIASGRCTPAEFDRVHAPIGLDIGAITVPEIAASIVAQLIAVRRLGRTPLAAQERDASRGV